MLAKGNMRQPSIMPANVQASRIGLPDVERSTFRRPETITTTLDAGWLYPVYVAECLPGDVWKANLDVFVRMMTLLRPIMSNVHIDLFAFFQANRVSWPNWEKLQGQQDNPGDSTDYLVPHIYNSSATSWTPFLGSIYDYMGLPVEVPIHQSGVTAPRFVNALPMRMYNQIIDKWFRDQDFQDRPEINTGDGPDHFGDYNLIRRNKRQDIFTTARPWPQKGPAVTIPIGSDSAPVVGNNTAVNIVRGSGTAGGQALMAESGGANGMRFANTLSNAVPGTAATAMNPSSSVLIGLHPNPLYSGMVADLSSAFATSINTIRDAVVLQQMLELDARGGTRYIESLFTRWRVVVQDDRLQRPEYIGGFSQMLDISAVPQTSESTEGNPLSQLSGYGTGGKVNHHLSYSVPEHGFIMILVNIRADLTYSQQLDKFWTRRARFDYPEPLTMHIGEQPILASEVVYDSDGPSLGDTVFGYQEAWADYRYSKNLVTGLMRPGVTGSLANWNLAIAPNDVPVQLDGDFLYDNPPISRVIAVTSQPAFNLNMTVKASWARALPVYSTPGLDMF